MEFVNLTSISRAEIAGKKPAFLKTAFTGKLVKPRLAMIGDELVHAVLVGGYPEMLRRENSRRRQTWARDYVKAIVQWDVRDIAEIEKLDQVHANDFKGTRKLLDICGDDLKLGVELYDGTKVVPFGDRLFAAPMSCLWS